MEIFTPAEMYTVESLMSADSRRVSQHRLPRMRVQFVTEEDSPFQTFWRKSIDYATGINDVTKHWCHKSINDATDINDVTKTLMTSLVLSFWHLNYVMRIMTSVESSFKEENFKVMSTPLFETLNTCFFSPTANWCLVFLKCLKLYLITFRKFNICN